jgi:hypothetical protein
MEPLDWVLLIGMDFVSHFMPQGKHAHVVIPWYYPATGKRARRPAVMYVNNTY